MPPSGSRYEGASPLAVSANSEQSAAENVPAATYTGETALVDLTEAESVPQAAPSLLAAQPITIVDLDQYAAEGLVMDEGVDYSIVTEGGFSTYVFQNPVPTEDL